MVKTLQRKFLFASMLAVTILLVTLVGAINIIYCYSVYAREKSMLEMLCETDGRPEGPRALRDADGRPGENNTGTAEDGQFPDPPDLTDLQQGDMADGRINREDSTGFLRRGMSMDDALSARFFAAWLDEEGKILLTDTSKIYAVSEDGAQEMAQEIVSKGKSTGVYQGFRYMIAENISPMTADDMADTAQKAVQEDRNDQDSFPGKSASAGQQAQTEAVEINADRILVALDISSDTNDMLRILGISVLIAALCWAAMLLPVHALAKRAIAPTAMSIERQKQFVTNAGHELKTPLAIIQANTDALELYTGESKWTRNIRAQTIRLNGLMQNLLTLSRMDENSLKLEKKPFALNLLVGEVWENFAEPAAGRKLSVQIETDEDREVKVLANRESIAQLLSILFDNAVKYTPRGGQIEVRICPASDTVNLIQSNTVSEEEGKSLLSEDADRLFERFYRTDSDRSRKKGGYGIGLSAARAIAGANNGTIRAEAGEGKIVLTVTLKKASA